MKTVNIQETGRHAHPGQDRRLPGVVTHPRPQRASDRSRVGIRATWLRGRCRLGHRPVVMPAEGPRLERPSVIVGTGKVSAASGWPVIGVTSVNIQAGGKVVAPGVRLGEGSPRTRRPQANCKAGKCIPKDSTHDLWLFCGIS